MNCCKNYSKPFNKFFDQKLVRKELAAYRKRGPAPSTKKLINAIRHFKNGNLSEKSLLDIGGGLGTIGLELAIFGVKDVVNLEASVSYLQLAKEEVQEKNLQGNFKFVEGLISEIGEQIDTADIVTLDKVICCNREYQDLVKVSLSKSKKLYGIVLPRFVWWVSTVNYIGNLFRRITGNSFQSYIHPTQEIEKLISQNGFSKIFDEVAREWKVQLYVKQ